MLRLKENAVTEMIYSTQKVKNAGDRKVKNPVHFVSPVEGVKKVYVQDGYPNVVSAYERAGATVKKLSDLPGQAATAPAPAEKKEK